MDCEGPRGVCTCGMCDHVVCVRDMCGVVPGVGSGCLPLFPPELHSSQPGLPQAQGPALLSAWSLPEAVGV